MERIRYHRLHHELRCGHHHPITPFVALAVLPFAEPQCPQVSVSVPLAQLHRQS